MKIKMNEKFNISNTEKKDSKTEQIDLAEKELKSLSQDNFLLFHQTDQDSANEITNSEDYFGDCGLKGTAIVNQNVTDVLEVFREVDKPVEKRERGITHKGASSVVVLVFPKKYIDNPKDILEQIDNLLIDKFSSGEFSEFGLPRKFVFGYYNQGRFNFNNNFNPSFE